MAQYTSFLGLYKPDRIDRIAIDTSLANNFEAIDKGVEALSIDVLSLGHNSFSYNADGTVDVITTPTGTTYFNYDSEGQMTSAVEERDTQTITTSFNYDNEGNLESITREVS